MSRSRIEGLLSSFPKLINVGDQHTFVETENVRYVYQPLDKLYIVLITNKSSNILQDIETIQLFSRIVSEYCRSTDEKEITKQRFELILVFDEVISLGYKENVNLGQIKTISLMESNDERIEAEIQKNKEREAKEESKRRAQLMELKRQEAKSNASKMSSDFNSSYRPSSNYGDIDTSSRYTPPVEPVQNYQPKPTPVNMGKGMQLGKKSNQTSLFETIKKEEGVQEMAYIPPEPTQPTQPTQPLQTKLKSPSIKSPVIDTPVDEKSVHFVVQEKISVVANRDGGLKSMEVNGSMMLKVNNPSTAHITTQLQFVPDNNLQFRAHPNIDKNAWTNNSVLVLRDTSRPFPVSQPLGVLKWRYASNDEQRVPLLVNCWPSPGNGSCDVTMEYELQNRDLILSDVSIIIRYDTSNAPTINNVDSGEYAIDRAQRTLIWNIDHISSNNSNGCLEFHIESDDVSTLYPIQIHFTSKTLFSGINIAGVALLSGGATEFSSDIGLQTENYQIE